MPGMEMWMEAGPRKEMGKGPLRGTDLGLLAVGSIASHRFAGKHILKPQETMLLQAFHFRQSIPPPRDILLLLFLWSESLKTQLTQYCPLYELPPPRQATPHPHAEPLNLNNSLTTLDYSTLSPLSYYPENALRQ